MGFFNDSLTHSMRETSCASVNEISETDNSMDCPECSSLITPANNWYYSTMMVPKEFKEKVLVHVVSQYMTLNEFFVPPLYLAIEGPAGEGKTSQTIAVLPLPGQRRRRTSRCTGPEWCRPSDPDRSPAGRHPRKAP